jgi:hypothetical protein
VGWGVKPLRLSALRGDTLPSWRGMLPYFLSEQAFYPGRWAVMVSRADRGQETRVHYPSLACIDRLSQHFSLLVIDLSILHRLLSCHGM